MFSIIKEFEFGKDGVKNPYFTPSNKKLSH